ncbi:AEC family transporter [Dubosiella newyorkensis]|uniref:AEC family transporter n=1 Tax=Dubosiella newyorkensis TaxID=1862672 RepID=UPI00273196E5|nr:AEC family transporter [Dubosiella newyorkensis]
MISVIEKTSTYLLFIVFGYAFKYFKILDKDDANKLGKIIVLVTLPAALIKNADSIVIQKETLLLASLGIVTNMFGLLTGFFLNHRERSAKTAAIMLSTASYNIGNFVLPFVEMFFGGVGVGYLCMFDCGNALMGLGLNLVAAQSVSMKTMRVSLRSILKTLLKSAPFVTYVLLFVFAFLNLSVPSYIMDVANVAGGANSFLSMFMIGLLIRLDLPKEKLKAIYKTVWARTLLNTALIVLILFFMPIPATARIVTALCIASPVGSISPIYALQCGYKGDLVGMASSLSIFVSIVQILAILIIFA